MQRRVAQAGQGGRGGVTIWCWCVSCAYTSRQSDSIACRHTASDWACIMLIARICKPHMKPLHGKHALRPIA